MNAIEVARAKAEMVHALAQELEASAKGLLAHLETIPLEADPDSSASPNPRHHREDGA